MGSLGRFWLTEACTTWLGRGFPWGTVIVNISGCFIIGLFGVLTEPGGVFPASHVTRQFVMIGICGGYTTFSSFSLQTLQMFQKGAFVEAGLHILGSLILCLLSVWAGSLMAAAIQALKNQ